jgi:predicted transposase/invertase (TIGR01784 family)
MPAKPPVGLAILQLLSAPLEQARSLVSRLLRTASEEFADAEAADKAVELVEELLVRRFPKLGREEIRAMFELEDLRKTRVWQEARAEGRQEGREEGREQGREEGREELVRKWLANGKTVKEIAELLDTSVQEVRRLSKNGRN